MSREAERQYREYARHDKVLARAIAIFDDRSGVRGNLWAESGYEPQVRMIEEKVARVRAAIKLAGEQAEPTDAMKDAMTDDLLDIINFAVFAVRHIEGDLPDVGPG